MTAMRNSTYGGGESDLGRIRKYAAELAALAPDVILAVGPSSVAALLDATRTVPIVFTIVPDPVGAGFVDSLAEPSGNATGFLTFEYSLAGKWLELLKEVAPKIRRVAVLRDPATTAGTGQFAVIQSVAPSVGVDLRPIDVRDPAEIERGVVAFSRYANGGMVVTASTSAVANRELIIALAAQHKVPTVYYERLFAAAGGLISYGPSFRDIKVVDLAFRDETSDFIGWTVVDFKTDRELEESFDRYVAQVNVYAQAVGAATRTPTRGIVLIV